MSRILTSKKRFLLGVAAALVVATAAFAYWTTGGSGGGEGDVAGAATGTITLDGAIDDADFRPGHTSPVSLTASNTDEETDLRVQSTTITGIEVTDEGTAHDGCLEAWFSGYGDPVTQDQTIAAGAEDVPLDDPHRITFDNADANQDECKGATVTFTLTSN